MATIDSIEGVEPTTVSVTIGSESQTVSGENGNMQRADGDDGDCTAANRQVFIDAASEGQLCACIIVNADVRIELGDQLIERMTIQMMGLGILEKSNYYFGLIELGEISFGPKSWFTLSIDPVPERLLLTQAGDETSYRLKTMRQEL